MLINKMKYLITELFRGSAVKQAVFRRFSRLRTAEVCDTLGAFAVLRALQIETYEMETSFGTRVVALISRIREIINRIRSINVEKDDGIEHELSAAEKELHQLSNEATVVIMKEYVDRKRESTRQN